MTEKIHKSEDEWKQQLTPEQYYVTRQAGTEPAFSGPYYHHKAQGTYHCICCENPLFRSENKFESGTGWPSFTQPSNEEALETNADHSYGMTRVEVTCSRCDAHLGHALTTALPRRANGSVSIPCPCVSRVPPRTRHTSDPSSCIPVFS